MGSAGVNSSLCWGAEARAARGWRPCARPIERARVLSGALLGYLCAQLALLVPAAAAPAPARAQQETDSPASAEGASTGDEVIVDPELSGIAPPPSPTPAAQPAAAAPNGEVWVQLHSRIALDVAEDAPREDLWEATQIALLEARVRRSETLRFALGLRVRHQFALRRYDTIDADRDRTTLDLAPTAGYGDVTLDDGLHLRVGYQSVRLGSFELINASDVLSVYDLRGGPTTFPEAFEIAQLAARVDWDASSWLSLTLIGVPFFQPHRVNVLDGNYALYPQGEIVAPENLTPEQARRRALSRSAQARLADGALAAFAPDPNLEHPQAALHAMAHGAAGELRFTAALARDQVFTVTTDPTLAIDYAPFGLFSAEGTIGLGSLQLGAELAYMLQRTVPTDSGDPDALPTADRTDIAHLGVRLEHAQEDLFGFLIEASASRTLDPRGSSGPWLGTQGRHWFLAVAAIGQLALDPFTIELSGGLVNGPSYLLAPRVELELVEGLYLETGAYLIGAIDPPADRTGWLPGDLYEHADQVFLGVRWTP